MFTFNKEKKYSALDMNQYGIATIVLVVHEDLDKQLAEYKKVPDENWLGGLGKKYLHKMLEINLKKEDKFFNENAHLVNVKNQRWKDFCDDCVIYATLNNYLYDVPLHLIHPSVYDEYFKNSIYDVPNIKPAVIEGITALN